MAFTEKIKEKVLKKARFKCCVCRAHPAVHVHHIIPQKDNGPDTEDNAAPLCPNCHDTYGGNPEKQKYIRRNRDDWYEFCENLYTSDDKISQDIFEHVKELSTKEDLNNAVKYIVRKFEKIQSEPISTSSMVEQISDISAAFSCATTSANITPLILDSSDIVYHICGNCRYYFDSKNEKCPKCGYPKR